MWQVLVGAYFYLFYLSLSHCNDLRNVYKLRKLAEYKVNSTEFGTKIVIYGQIDISIALDLVSKQKINNTIVNIRENIYQNKIESSKRRVQPDNQTSEESINNLHINNGHLTNSCDNMSDQGRAEQTRPDSEVSKETSVLFMINVTYTNKSTRNMEMVSLIKPRPRPSFSKGILSEAQEDEYIEIIKAIKWALNFIAFLVTLMSAIAFGRTKNRSSSTTFIVALNIFGFFAALLSIVGYTLSFALGGATQFYLIYTQYMNMYTGAVCRRIVYMLNMLMSGQRLTVLALPFLARTKFRHSINMAIIIAVVVITFATHVYIPISYVVIDAGSGSYRLGHSSLYDNTSREFEAASSATKFIFAFIPLTASLLANLILLVYLKRHSRKAKNLHAVKITDQVSSRQNRQVTLIVLVSSVSFTLLSFPANIHLLVTTYTTDYGYNLQEHHLFMVVHEVLLGLLTLGDITNFLSYMLLSSAFREQFNTTFFAARTTTQREAGTRSDISHGTSSSCFATR